MKEIKVGTPVGAYAQLVDWYNKGDLDFSEVTTVNLDEYRGLPTEHPESYWSFMHKNLFDKVNIRPEAIHLPCLLYASAFRPLTFVPIATSPGVPGVLTRDELDWLNAYHREVFEKLAPRLNEEERDWLAKKCAAIGA